MSKAIWCNSCLLLRNSACNIHRNNFWSHSVLKINCWYIWMYRRYNLYSWFMICNGYPAGNYLFKVKNRSTKTRCEICSKLTIKLRIVSILNFEHVTAGWVLPLLLSIKYIPILWAHVYFISNLTLALVE